MVAATLVLNWHEDGMIYRTRLRSMRKNSAGGGGGTANNVTSVAPMRLNPVIRCLRLMLVLAFVAIDVGLTLWEVPQYFAYQSANSPYTLQVHIRHNAVFKTHLFGIGQFENTKKHIINAG